MDWKRKLTSRKFWAAVAGFVTGLIVYAQNPTGSAEAIGGIIMSAGSVFSYIFGEGWSDAANAKADVIVTTESAGEFSDLPPDRED